MNRGSAVGDAHNLNTQMMRSTPVHLKRDRSSVVLAIIAKGRRS